MGTLAVVLGGIGLFLLGMILMTDGLKSVAGNSLRAILGKFTGGIFTSICSGTLLTAIIQSSSATMLMTIGFVSAGLLTFTQSIGVVFGANLGSSTIGWIVSIIGLKVSVGAVALPLIGVGALCRFSLPSKFASYGMVIAGFGLIFLGIGTLQDGMAGLSEWFSFESLHEQNIWHQLLLIAIGLVMTVIMQSSSTALVITLTALAAQTLSFEQAALLVIGQNIGTTVKAFFVTIGGTVAARRTAMTHIAFNVTAGIIAFVTLPFFVKIVQLIGEKWLSNDTTIMLALFSTLFYVIGIAVVLPFLPYFIRIVTRLVPEKGDRITKYLDESVVAFPPIAIEAVRRTLIRVTRQLSLVGEEVYTKKKMTTSLQTAMDEVLQALDETRQFVAKIEGWEHSKTSKEYYQQIALIHALDHLSRLAKALQEKEALESFSDGPVVTSLALQVATVCQAIQTTLTYDQQTSLVERVKNLSMEVANLRRMNRKIIIEKTVLQQSDIDSAIGEVQSLHWVDRVVYHLWRAMHHLQKCLHAEESTLE